MDYAIPLKTKYWEIDYGTLRSIPDSGYIEKIHIDADGSFIFYCKSENGFLYWDLRNAPDNFDYTITVYDSYENNVIPSLNSSIAAPIKGLFNWENMHYFVNQKLKFAYNFFFYEKLGSPEAALKMRNFIRKKYNYIPSPIIPISTAPSSTVSSSRDFKQVSSDKPLETNTKPFSDKSIVFYINSLHTPFLSTSSPSTLITPKDMIKTLILPDGTSATICKMEYFIEENFGKFNFDSDAFRLFGKYKFAKYHQICIGCPKNFEVTKCDIWQRNFDGYYLCSTCCLGLHRSDGRHKCHVPGNTIQNRYRSAESNGLCSRCSFYYRPNEDACPRVKGRKIGPRPMIQHINYSAFEFFKILLSNNPEIQVPVFFDWQLQENPEFNKSTQESPIKDRSNIFDDPQLSITDTIKDTEKLSINDETKSPAKNNEKQQEAASDDSWEFADNCSESDYFIV